MIVTSTVAKFRLSTQVFHHILCLNGDICLLDYYFTLVFTFSLLQFLGSV